MTELWEMDQDRRNAVVFKENRERPLLEVLAEAVDVHQQLLAALDALSEADFVDPRRFRDMPTEWRPWRLFAGTTYEHYRAHLPDLEAAHYGEVVTGQS